MGYITLKIDLEKAYDKLEWSFIRDILFRANFLADLIDIIMSCVSMVSTSILFNGEVLDLIFSSRGIRQGDPLSLTFSFFAWISLSNLLRRNAMPSFGNRLRLPKVVLPSPIFYSRMILSFLQKLMVLMVQP